MRRKNIVSQTPTTRHGVQSQKLSKIRPTHLTPFFLTLTVPTVYKKWLPTRISCEFKILDNLVATMSKIKITCYKVEFFLFYSQNSRYNCVILGSIINFKKIAHSLKLSPQDPAIYLQNCARSALVDNLYYFFSWRKCR